MAELAGGQRSTEMKSALLGYQLSLFQDRDNEQQAPAQVLHMQGFARNCFARKHTTVLSLPCSRQPSSPPAFLTAHQSRNTSISRFEPEAERKTRGEKIKPAPPYERERARGDETKPEPKPLRKHTGIVQGTAERCLHGCCDPGESLGLGGEAHAGSGRSLLVVHQWLGPVPTLPKRLPTCDIDFHQARPCADGVGGLTDVRPSQAVGDGAFEEERVVLDLHVFRQRPIQPAARQQGVGSQRWGVVAWAAPGRAPVSLWLPSLWQSHSSAALSSLW